MCALPVFQLSMCASYFGYLGLGVSTFLLSVPLFCGSWYIITHILYFSLFSSFQLSFDLFLSIFTSARFRVNGEPLFGAVLKSLRNLLGLGDDPTHESCLLPDSTRTFFLHILSLRSFNLHSSVHIYIYMSFFFSNFFSIYIFPFLFYFKSLFCGVCACGYIFFNGQCCPPFSTILRHVTFMVFTHTPPLEPTSQLQA